jgi:hypothetical protein
MTFTKTLTKTLNIKRIPTRSPSTRIEWDVTVDAETTVEDLLNPIFWSHAAGSTFNGQNNLVTVYWDDKSQLAELYVQSYSHTGAKMQLLSHYVFDDVALEKNDGEYKISFAGPVKKFKISRDIDGVVIKDGIQTKSEAIKFLEEYKLKTN